MISLLADDQSLEAKSTTSSGETNNRPIRPTRVENIRSRKPQLSLAAGTFGCRETQVHRKIVVKQLHTRPASVLQWRMSLHEWGGKEVFPATSEMMLERGNANATNCTARSTSTAGSMNMLKDAL